MKKEHPHAQVLRWIADGETVQSKLPGYDEFGWKELSDMESLPIAALVVGKSIREFRIKPKTITVGDREIEAPVMSGPGYFMHGRGDTVPFFGNGSDHPEFVGLQERGLVFASPEAARAAQEAITALLTREPS